MSTISQISFVSIASYFICATFKNFSTCECRNIVLQCKNDFDKLLMWNLNDDVVFITSFDVLVLKTIIIVVWNTKIFVIFSLVQIVFAKSFEDLRILFFLTMLIWSMRELIFFEISTFKNAFSIYIDAAYDSRSKISTASCILYQSSRTTYKTWNLGIEMSIDDAKLYAIEKVTKWFETLQNFEHIWIFSDSQTAIRCIENCTHFLADEIHKTTEKSSSKTHIHWISEHADISQNEKANQLARSVFSSSTITRDRFLSFKFLNDQITEQNRQRWLNSWKINTRKGKLYEKFDTILEDSKIQLLSKKFTKHVIFTIMQLKFEHEYFRSYLVKLSNYETNKCNENCNSIQTSKHLLLHCRHFTNQRSIMINEMKSQTTTLKTLFETKKDIEKLRKFLIDTEIATRKWILEDAKEEKENEYIFSMRDLQMIKKSLWLWEDLISQINSNEHRKKNIKEKREVICIIKTVS